MLCTIFTKIRPSANLLFWNIGFYFLTKVPQPNHCKNSLRRLLGKIKLNVKQVPKASEPHGSEIRNRIQYKWKQLACCAQRPSLLPNGPSLPCGLLELNLSTQWKPRAAPDHLNTVAVQLLNLPCPRCFPADKWEIWRLINDNTRDWQYIKERGHWQIHKCRLLSTHKTCIQHC